ncbi:CRISPR-associated protein Cse1 [Deinococcus sp. RL]|uniref:type I-C CRISPR-associated protein Cas5c n=1 Tax=Deinococcus sp. RL TaxID=1489678 RepID=UPI0004D55AC9|nr:type I-C CRISPR-associated protein Cas5c [Deinococcus sp. RL]KEF33976.1 CRISPR-associated protein Cse1 [Deinococcus sp. RL]
MLELKVWSDFACFTRPENKAERVSYDVMTPSAARGVLEAVFWKPEFAWQVREIVVLREVKRLSLLRNEVNTLASERSAKAWAKEGGGFFADEDRAQRHTLLLRDVAYLIRAEMVLRPHAKDPLQKYQEIFLRRAEKGQAFHQPYLGNREFTAFFSLPDGNERPANVVRQLGGEYAERENQLSLGRMLFDLEFREAKGGRLEYRQHGSAGARWVKGQATPRFFDAVLTDGGILRVPAHLYGEVGE